MNWKHALLTSIALPVLVVIAGCAKDSREVLYKTVADKNDPDKEVKLYLHVFEPEERDAKKPLPAIVFFFGGGWKSGNPKQFYPHCEYLASRGMVAVSAEYRVKSRHDTSPFECVKDGKSAVRYLRAHAGELGIDPRRIAAGGGSAGGHVAACTGVVEGQEEASEDTRVSSQPNAMVLFNPVVDVIEMLNRRAVSQDTAELRSSGTAISPIVHVRKGLPPAIIFHGKDDESVPYSQVERFTQRMRQVGNTCRLVGYEGKGHGFFNLSRDREAFAATVTEADRFLAGLGYLAGKPAVEAYLEGLQR